MRQCLSHCLLPDRLLGQHKATQPNNPKSTDLSKTITLNKAQDTFHRSDYPAFLTWWVTGQCLIYTGWTRSSWRCFPTLILWFCDLLLAWGQWNWYTLWTDPARQWQKAVLQVGSAGWCWNWHVLMIWSWYDHWSLITVWSWCVPELSLLMLPERIGLQNRRATHMELCTGTFAQKEYIMLTEESPHLDLTAEHWDSVRKCDPPDKLWGCPPFKRSFLFSWTEKNPQSAYSLMHVHFSQYI